nr:winged helix-turn-helix domain-containing protein [Sphingomonas vulcanisoli]
MCVEGGDRDQRAAIAHALGALGHEVIAGGDLRVVIAPPVQIDRAAGVALVAGRRVRLTRIELALLGCLIDAPEPLDKPALIARIWGYGFDPGTNLVAVHISRLRAKLGAALTIVYGEGGYAITAETSPAVPVRNRQNRTPERRCS